MDGLLPRKLGQYGRRNGLWRRARVDVVLLLVVVDGGESSVPCLSGSRRMILGVV